MKALVLLVCAFVLEILAKYGLKLKARAGQYAVIIMMIIIILIIILIILLIVILSMMINNDSNYYTENNTKIMISVRSVPENRPRTDRSGRRRMFVFFFNAVYVSLGSSCFLYAL